MRGGRLEGWGSSSRRNPDGSVESEQRVVAPRPVVAGTLDGARKLADVYWSELEHLVGGVVRARTDAGGIELRVLRLRPPLLRFAPPVVDVGDGVVSCSFPIAGGVLARRPGGSITFAQSVNGEVLLVSRISGFSPVLAASPGAPDWAGTLYTQIQHRLHVTLSHRYFRRLVAEAPA